MNISGKFARLILIEKLKVADEKIRQVDGKIYGKEKLQPEWRLTRDAALIIEEVIEGFDVAEDTHECDC